MTYDTVYSIIFWMSSINELARQFILRPETVTLNDIKRLLGLLDYKEKKKPGSECVFHKKGVTPLNVPTVKGRKVKLYYIKRIAKILNLEDYLEES